MGLFDIFKKDKKPYKSDAINLIYELLFCDRLELFKEEEKQQEIYPFKILFSNNSSEEELNRIISDENIESRIKILAYNKLKSFGKLIKIKDLYGVVVEIGLDNGLDVIAAFRDGTARYINQSEKLIVFESVTDTSKKLTEKLFINSEAVVKNIGPWDKPRRPAPEKGIVRITFLVSDGLYFGEGPVNVLFNDAMAGPALTSAFEFLKYLVEQ